MKRTQRICYHFRGVDSPPASTSPAGFHWVKKITAAGGSPTVKSASGGAMELTLDNTNEAQNLCLYMGDVLPFDIDDLIRVEILAAATASLDSTVTAVFGVASARNDDPDAIAEAALFKLAGSNSVVCESDDGTNNNDDKATSESLSTTFRRFVIDFSSGVQTRTPPSLSLGGKGNVGFYMENSNGYLRRVAKNTLFDMSNYGGNLQLLAQIQKTAGTVTGALKIKEFVVEFQV